METQQRRVSRMFVAATLAVAASIRAQGTIAFENPSRLMVLRVYLAG
jgi:hypothetical protein